MLISIRSYDHSSDQASDTHSPSANAMPQRVDSAHPQYAQGQSVGTKNGTTEFTSVRRNHSSLCDRELKRQGQNYLEAQK